MNNWLFHILVFCLITGSIVGVLVFLVMWADRDAEYAWKQFYKLVATAMKEVK